MVPLTCWAPASCLHQLPHGLGRMAAESAATHQAAPTQQPKGLREVLGRHCLEAVLQCSAIAIDRVCTTQTGARHTCPHVHSRARDFAQLPQLRRQIHHRSTSDEDHVLTGARLPCRERCGRCRSGRHWLHGLCGRVNRAAPAGARGDCARDMSRPEKGGGSTGAIAIGRRNAGHSRKLLGSVFSSERAANDAVRGADLLPVVLSGQA